MTMALLRLTRPWYSLPLSCGLLVIILYVSGGDFSGPGIGFVCAFLSLYLMLSSAYVQNDVCDAKVDAVNNPDKVIPKGLVSLKLASFVHVLLLSSGLMLSLFCGLKYFGVLFITAMGLMVYNFYSKRLGIFKDILAAALTTSLYPLAFAAADPVITPRLNSLFIFPVWLFLTAVGYEMLKDIRDIKGDNVVIKKRAFVSDSRFLLSARILLMAAGLMTLLPYILGYCGNIYLISSVIAIMLVTVSIALPAVKAIPFIYAEVFLITAGSLADLWVYGP